ncbi:MAG: lasso RiPP family leader peptide-containing protein [Proteobacteria bacterium]|nr:lasso RiPP family leader peptide-containing protein [Pseudomonadota bacterium]
MKSNSTRVSPQPDESAGPIETGKPYEAPALIRWGTLQEVTRAVGNKGASDGGSKNEKRTSF